MKHKIRIYFIAAMMGVFLPVSAHACGVCVDKRILYFFPFIKAFLLILPFWSLVFILFLSSIKDAMPFNTQLETDRLFYLFLTLVMGVIAGFILTMGSTLIFITYVIIPTWLIFMIRSQWAILSIKNRDKGQSVFATIQWSIIALMVIAVLYSIGTNNSMERRIEKLAFSSPPASKKLISKIKSAYPDIAPLIVDFKDNFKANDSNKTEEFLILIRVVKMVEDPTMTLPLAEAVQKIKFKKFSYYMEKIYTESADYIFSMDKELAREVVLVKLEDLVLLENFDDLPLDDTMDRFLTICEGDKASLISAFKIIGAPNYGTDVNDYKIWWRNKTGRS